ncbi:MAG: hypothetical protein SO148_03595 [Candidatus Onthovivens sp.]|nr:hypothetical protein [Candidatus Onthovivens sp.]
MRNYEKNPKNKTKLKLYQKAIISVFIALFLVATVVICILYKDFIFSENALAYSIGIILVILLVIGFVLLQVFDK